MQNKTIAAISTAPMPGGIGIIRISGSKSKMIAAKVFKPINNRDIKKMQGYTACFGHVFYENERLDEAVALVFNSPHSYTGEDVVELSVHGGVFVLNKLLRAVISAGATPAGKGEFTKRAFINGKISLDQAEAVMDIISATGEQALRSANAAKSGALYKKIAIVKEILTSAAASLTAYIDFADEGLSEFDSDIITTAFLESKAHINELINNYDKGKIIKNGIRTAIIGKPNVGKSSLMNALTRYDRSIVTEQAGTTRDIIEETISVGGITIRLFDTAGIREASDSIEKIGIERAEENLSNADIVLAIFDGSEKPSGEDRQIIELIKNKKSIIILNKTDLKEKNRKDWHNLVGEGISISAKTGAGIDKLENEIESIIGTEAFDPSSAHISNERQLNCMKRAKELIITAESEYKNGQTLDAISMLTEETICVLCELTGENVSEKIINEVFEKFCIGK